MRNKYAIIDYLRGYSIITIVLMHLIQGSLSGAIHKAAAFGGSWRTCIYLMLWIWSISVIFE